MESSEQGRQFLREWMGQWTPDRSAMFFQQYECIPRPSPEEIRHNKIADEYVRRTELFDMTLPGEQKKGWWLPYPEYMQASTRHALRVREDLADFGRAVGVEKLSVRRSERHADRTLKPPPHAVMPFIHRKTEEHNRRCVHQGGQWVYDDGHTFVEFLIEYRGGAIVADVWLIHTREKHANQGWAKLALMRMSCFFDAVVAREIMPHAEVFWVKMKNYGFIKSYD